jgi:hypothetical protein
MILQFGTELGPYHHQTNQLSDKQPGQLSSINVQYACLYCFYDVPLGLLYVPRTSDLVVKSHSS